MHHHTLLRSWMVSLILNFHQSLMVLLQMIMDKSQVLYCKLKLVDFVIVGRVVLGVTALFLKFFVLCMVAYALISNS